jgi:hypothetical protein
MNIEEQNIPFYYYDRYLIIIAIIETLKALELIFKNGENPTQTLGPFYTRKSVSCIL